MTVFSCLFNDDGTIVVGTSAGVFRKTPGASEYQVLERFERPALGLTDQVPLGLATTPGGDLLVSDNVYGYRIVGGNATTQLKSIRARGRSLLRDREGAIWFGTSGQGCGGFAKPTRESVSSIASPR